MSNAFLFNVVLPDIYIIFSEIKTVIVISFFT